MTAPDLTSLSRAADGLSALTKLLSAELVNPRLDPETTALGLTGAQELAGALAEKYPQPPAFALEAVLELAKRNLATAPETVVLALDGAALWAGDLSDRLLLEANQTPL